MTLEHPLWAQELTYPARLDRQLIMAAFDLEGVVQGLRVTQRGAGANMSVDIASGTCIIDGDDQAFQGSYLGQSSATVNVTIGAAPGSNSRIDLIVARVYDPNAGSGSSAIFTFEAIAGSVSGSPVAPALPNTAIPIAQVLVTNGDTSVVNAAITDARTPARARGAVPTGTIQAFAGATVPDGWFLCNGQAISRTTYWQLFRAIGTTYGTGDGSTTFNVPDLRGRALFGLDNMGGSDAGRISVANTLGTTDGAETFNLVEGNVPSHTHTINHAHTGSTASSSAHTHSVTDPGHAHGIPRSTDSPLSGATNYIAGNVDNGQSDTYNANTGISIGSGGVHDHTVTVDTYNGNSGTGSGSGSNVAHLPPLMVINWIIRG